MGLEVSQAHGGAQGVVRAAGVLRLWRDLWALCGTGGVLRLRRETQGSCGTEGVLRSGRDPGDREGLECV